MAELVDLVVDKYDGSLKAEHGTGINMAPFVEREWGREGDRADVAGQGARRSRRRALARRRAQPRPGDPPQGPQEHARRSRRRPTPASSAASASPSARAATSRRRRASGSSCAARWRASPPGSPVLEALLREYEYDGLETCAADGSCKLACPVGIDTGKLVKGLRERQHGARAERVALEVARRWALVERAARAGLRAGNAVADRLGPGAPAAATRALRAAAGAELVPTWPANMPDAGPGDGCPRPRARAPPPSTCRPASTASSAPPRATARAPEPARGAGDRVGARRPARVDPRGRRRHTAARRRGAARATAPGTRTWPTRSSTRCGGGPAGARCRSWSTPARARSACSRTSRRISTTRTRAATASWRSSTRSSGRTTGCCRA